MAWVVDASVATKWFFQESLTEEARRIIASGRPVLAPDCLITEVCNVAWQRVVRNEASAEHAAALYEVMLDILSQVVSTLDLVPRALELATQIESPVYDCLYVALAEAKEATLVSADRVFIDRLSAARWPGGAIYLGDVSPRVAASVTQLSAVAKAR